MLSSRQGMARLLLWGYCYLLFSAATSGAVSHGTKEDNTAYGDPPPVTKPFYLRILPLGASITYGYKSADGNGYRRFLRDKLRFDGWAVNMVGNMQHGTMIDSDTEGHTGATIDVVASAIAGVAHRRPNVVLLNAGTNDCVLDVDLERAGERMAGLIARLQAAVPGATVVLSTLLPERDDAVYRRVRFVNGQYRRLAAELAARGERVVLADMEPSLDRARDVRPDDGVHPTARGNLVMAAVWYAAIRDALDRGLVVAPDADAAAADTCDPGPAAPVPGLVDGRGHVPRARARSRSIGPGTSRPRLCPRAAGDALGDDPDMRDPRLPFVVRVAPGDNATRPWEAVPCSAGVLGMDISPYEQWATAHADFAFADVVRMRLDDPTGFRELSTQAASVFLAPPAVSTGITCSRVGNPFCQQHFGCPTMGSFAGYLIMNSFATLNRMLDTFRRSVETTTNGIELKVSTLMSTFGGTTGPGPGMDVLNWAYVGFAAISTKSFRALLPPVPDKTEPRLALETIGQISAEIALDRSEPALTESGDLIGAATGILNQWQVAARSLGKRLFRDGSSTDLHNIIRDGALVGAMRQESGSIQVELEKMLYTFMIPFAWSSSYDTPAPVVIHTGLPCIVDKILDVPAPAGGIARLIDEEIGNRAGQCHGSMLYFLVGVPTTNAYSCTQGAEGGGVNVTCEWGPLSLLPGQEELAEPSARWAGLNNHDIVAGAVNGWRKDGQHNGRPSKNVLAKPSEIVDIDATTAGLIHIPVCSGQEVLRNWFSHANQGYPRSGNYPCDGVAVRRTS